MRSLILLLVGLLSNACLGQGYLYVPQDWRQENWNRKLGPLGVVQSSYSCVYATNVTMLRWNADAAKAAHVRRTYYGRQNLSGIIRVLDREGLTYDYNSGDTSFLEWGIRNRMVVGLGGSPYPRHALCLVGLVGDKAYFVNNLSTGTRFEVMDKTSFYQHWSANGWAWVLFPPPAPLPIFERSFSQ